MSVVLLIRGPEGQWWIRSARDCQPKGSAKVTDSCFETIRYSLLFTLCLRPAHGGKLFGQSQDRTLFIEVLLLTLGRVTPE